MMHYIPPLFFVFLLAVMVGSVWYGDEIKDEHESKIPYDVGDTVKVKSFPGQTYVVKHVGCNIIGECSVTVLSSSLSTYSFSTDEVLLTSR